MSPLLFVTRLANQRPRPSAIEAYQVAGVDRSRSASDIWMNTTPAPQAGRVTSALRHGKAETVVTDGLRSYPAAMREIGDIQCQEMGRWRNNRMENSHLPFRRRERAMLRIRQMKTLQKFASVHAHTHFNQERHLVDRQTYRERRSAALAEWRSLAS